MENDLYIWPTQSGDGFYFAIASSPVDAAERIVKRLSREPESAPHIADLEQRLRDNPPVKANLVDGVGLLRVETN